MTILNSSFILPCGAVLKNRIVKAALTERLAKANALPNDKHLRLYQKRAENGAGLMISGNIIVDGNHRESIGNIVVDGAAPEEPFKVWTTLAKANGNHFWAQLSHAGRQTTIACNRHPHSPSDVQLKKMNLFGKPVPLTTEQIKGLVKRFGKSAMFCQKVGFTGVQIHAAHGYLISQFLSPKTNLRTDEYGGPIENRARFLFEIVARMRKKLGPDFPIAVKLNSADFQRGGFSADDSKFVILELEKLGVDLLEISGGTYEKSVFMGVDAKESTREREAYFLEFAMEVRKLTKMPLMVTGGFRTRSICEKVLEDDVLDMIGFGRPFLMDATFPRHFLDGTQDAVTEPKFKIIDKKNADAAEAGIYDLQIKRLAAGKELKFDYSGLKIASHIASLEIGMALRNWLVRG